MAQKASSPRDELIGIQRALARRLRDEIFTSLECPSPELRAYQEEYERSCSRGYRRILTQTTFLRRLSQADLIYQGDFHTLWECQSTTLKVLQGLASRRPFALALEMAPIAGQLALDAFIAGTISAETFLDSIDYANSWGFSWEQYRLVLEFARAHEIQVYGINSPPTGCDSSLSRRDLLAAEVIARATVSHPEAIVYVVAGDFHVCPSHLPTAVERVLEREGLRRRAAIVHQNIDDFYWDLARREEEHRARYLQIDRDEYCVMNSTPLVKYHSYLHWQLGQEEFHGTDGEEGLSSATIAEEVHRILKTITRFLGIRNVALDDFTVYTTHDLDFLSELEKRDEFSPREIREIKRQILNDESYFIGKGNIIYLSRLSLDHAAEEAAHYLNNKLSGCPSRPRSMRTDFYSRLLREALGFLGSKIINPLRHYHTEDDFREIVRDAPGHRQAAEGPIVLLARFVLQHLEAERNFLLRDIKPRLRLIHEQNMDLHLGITHSLGYILGDRLYQALVQGKVDRREVRRLFSLPLTEKDEAENVYFGLIHRLG